MGGVFHPPPSPATAIPFCKVMIVKTIHSTSSASTFVKALVSLAFTGFLCACGGGGGAVPAGTGNAPAGPPNYGLGVAPGQLFQVGSVTTDPNVPGEPSLPTAAQVCATLQASNNLVTRPDGALPPEADPSVAGAQIAQTATWAADASVGYTAPVPKVNPDQARIQAALNACGLQVDAQVGATIAAADQAAASAQATAASLGAIAASYKIGGVSAEELQKPAYKSTQFAVRLVVNSTGSGNAFISGPLTLPSGVTLWIDKGVTLYGSRDVMTYSPAAAGPYCANVAVSAIKAGSSSNCSALITETNLVNSAIVGDGTIDSRGYSEIVSSNKLYPLMKVDLSCSNTYAAYATATQAADGTACDDGGTFVDSKSSARNMTWWDLAWLGNMIDNGTTGVGSQSNPRMILVNYAKNFTLYHVTLSNSPNFHVVPSGVDGLLVWGVKVLTPSLAAYANPAGNGNPLYTGQIFNVDNVKNTDGFDVGAASKAILGKLSTGTATTSVTAMSFDGYLKNYFFVYNYVSTGDDDMALKGSNDPSPNLGIAAVDGSRGVFSTLPYGIVVAHNHFYWGHGVSVGSETNAGVKNVKVYDNSFNGGEEGIRIKSDWARGGEVSFVTYSNLCMRNMTNSLLFTPYYSTKALPAGGPLVPNFHDIGLNNIFVQGTSAVKLQGFEATAYNGTSYAQNPLVMNLYNVVTDSPSSVSLIDSDANLTLSGIVNLPLLPNSSSRVNVTGTAQNVAAGSGTVVDCSRAFVSYPSSASPFGSTWVPSTN